MQIRSKTSSCIQYILIESKKKAKLTAGVLNSILLGELATSFFYDCNVLEMINGHVNITVKHKVVTIKVPHNMFIHLNQFKTVFFFFCCYWISGLKMVTMIKSTRHPVCTLELQILAVIQSPAKEYMQYLIY